MFGTGNYPFTVRIFNFFDPGLETNLLVKRYHHRNFLKKDDEKYPNATLLVMEKLPEEGFGEEHTLRGGDSLAFPMYFGDERLEISLSGNTERLSEDYAISAGNKAPVIPSDDLGLPYFSIAKGNLSDDTDYYCGGIWSVSHSNTNWKLTIKKYGPDPEDDDISVGMDPPGGS